MVVIRSFFNSIIRFTLNFPLSFFYSVSNPSSGCIILYLVYILSNLPQKAMIKAVLIIYTPRLAQIAIDKVKKNLFNKQLLKAIASLNWVLFTRT